MKIAIYARVSTDKQGRVNGAIYFDAQHRECFQKAKAVVLCANGAETPRLLLLSKSSLFPQGLANSSGLVGKFLMLEATAGALGTFEHPLNEYKSVQVTRVIHDFYDYNSGLRWGEVHRISRGITVRPKDVEFCELLER